VAAGTVLVSGTRAEKPARLLRAALDRFPIAVTGRRALDAGASTGGFTDCLLQAGAAHVYAVDVGHGQLHPALRGNPGVTVLERTNVRTLTVDELVDADPAYEPCPLVVADLSFISLRSVVPALSGPVSTSDADLVLLVKPQFEAGRAAVSRGKGVIRDPALWLGALEGVVSALHDAKTGIMGAMVSPLTGSAGNVEFLVHARKGVAQTTAAEVAALLAAAVSEADGPVPPAAPVG